jgi:hypothetical protein
VPGTAEGQLVMAVPVGDPEGQGGRPLCLTAYDVAPSMAAGVDGQGRVGDLHPCFEEVEDEVFG